MPAPAPTPAVATRSQQGFTLVETLVGLAITAEVLLVAMLLFDVNSRIARNQVQVADMQQSQRIAHNDMARLIRMAGRGGLRQDAAVAVVNDANPNTDAVNGNPPVAGSDILTIRGALSSPMFQIRQAAANYTPPSGAQSTGTLVIESVSPTGIEQAVDAFDEIPRLNNVPSDALLLVSATSDAIYAVVEITGIQSSSNTDINGDGMNDRVLTITFSADLSGNRLSKSFGGLNSTPNVFPAGLAMAGSVGFAGLVEEYRYYVRTDSTAVGGYSPQLSRARFYPNTEQVYGEAANSTNTAAANGRVAIADNVLDLQVALGRDTNGDGQITEAVNRAADEWQNNDPGDNPSDFDPGDPIFNVQVVTLVRTDRFDRGFTADPIEEIFDHVYNEPTLPTSDQQRLDRSYRRQLVTTTVDLRNVN
ncbi:MAG TPA: PilW family protein [Thermoanaerobaculia bacterium]|nr:PilW family protein [Thermoanaerobaculia bacterium]